MIDPVTGRLVGRRRGGSYERQARKKDRARKKRKSKDKSRSHSRRYRPRPQTPPLGHATVYPHVNADFPASRFDIPGFKLKWGNARNYVVYDDKLLGEGAYGEVFLARHKDNKRRPICVKTIRPEKEEKIKIQREVKVRGCVCE